MAPRRKRVNAEPLAELYARPGFLLRRAHQIAVGIFLSECARAGLTPPQHGVLMAVASHEDISQSELARLLGFDRATVGQVVAGLVARELLRRSASATDRRNHALALTARGERLIRQASGAMQRTSARLLSPFTRSERELFMKLLTRLTTELNDESRTPVTRLDQQL
jgi:DNA-binding MarR family transcriptional regulator